MRHKRPTSKALDPVPGGSVQRGRGGHPGSGTKSQREKAFSLGQSKVQSHFTGDTVEVWMHSDLPRVLRKEKQLVELGVGPRSSLTSLDQEGPGENVRDQEWLGSLLREGVFP